jgi:hypothetical protein
VNAKQLTCRIERRSRVARARGVTGIDYLEVDPGTQRKLQVTLFGPAPTGLGLSNVRLEGGRRIRNVAPVAIELSRGGDISDDVIIVTVDRPGDFSTYTLSFVSNDGKRPHPDFDVRYASVDFSFKAACPSSLDCRTPAVFTEPSRQDPELDYLSKDYESFRRLLLDRLTLVMPDWKERHEADFGVAMVELLAYVGDQLSYFQDAVATEAYLETARLRKSVRRHARLVDYRLHEGINARAWIVLSGSVPGGTLPLEKVAFSTAGEEPLVFEPIATCKSQVLRILPHLEELSIYTWGNELCSLPRGATSATLVVPRGNAGPDESLREGDFLLFEEIKGAITGESADADPTRRHVVRLTRVYAASDPLYEEEDYDDERADAAAQPAEKGAGEPPSVDQKSSDEKKPPRHRPKRLLEIEWASEDALPFDLNLSARKPAPDCGWIRNITVARGNVFLVDHGHTISGDPAAVGTRKTFGECACDGSVVELEHVPEPLALELSRRPLTWRERVVEESGWSEEDEGEPPAPKSAAAWMRRDLRKADAQVVCWEGDDAQKLAKAAHQTPSLAKCPPGGGSVWKAVSDLLDCSGSDRHFAVEVNNEGLAQLRFGDGEQGRQPQAGRVFLPLYRIGNGSSGNVGAESIVRAHVRANGSSLNGLLVRNPLPARGAVDPESIAEAKLLAPVAFRTQLQRAVIADDYAALAERVAGVQRAGARLRWNGSWYTAEVAVDPYGGPGAPDSLLGEVSRGLYPYRRIGHDVHVREARYVPLDVHLRVCVHPQHLRGHVEAAVRQVLGSGVLPSGRKGFFHPDRLTFGDSVRLSALVAAVQGVTGVESVHVLRFERLGEGDQGERAAGVIRLENLEVAQLQNDPDFPEHGRLTLEIGGGR